MRLRYGKRVVLAKGDSNGVGNAQTECDFDTVNSVIQALKYVKDSRCKKLKVCELNAVYSKAKEKRKKI
jgi:hypothetical protein